jgi:hypothetical protein
MDIMSDEEYDCFEKRFIQIYVGQKRIWLMNMNTDKE